MRLRPEEIQVGDVFEAGDTNQYKWLTVSLTAKHATLKSTSHTYIPDITVLRSAIALHHCIERGIELLPYHDKS